jgi:hypothetical protein
MSASAIRTPEISQAGIAAGDRARRAGRMLDKQRALIASGDWVA